MTREISSRDWKSIFNMQIVYIGSSIDHLQSLTLCFLAITFHRSSHEYCCSHLNQTLAQSLQSCMRGRPRLWRATTEQLWHSQCHPKCGPTQKLLQGGWLSNVRAFGTDFTIWLTQLICLKLQTIVSFSDSNSLTPPSNRHRCIHVWTYGDNSAPWSNGTIV